MQYEDYDVRRVVQRMEEDLRRAQQPLGAILEAQNVMRSVSD